MWRGLLFGASLCHAHEDEQAMLQLHSRPRNDALGSEANPSSLISTVRQLARRATQQSPETVTALVESIDGTIQAMKLPLVTEHDAAQTLLDTQFEEITACGSMSSYSSDATAFQSLVQCRADVAAATDEKNEACELWLGEPSILQNQGDYPGCLPSIELRTAEEFFAHVEAWSTFTEAELSGLRTKKTNCETKTTVLTGEETRCAEEETEFDGAFCSRKTSCALLHACHDHEVANFDSLVNTLQSGEAARQAQFRSISQIECLLGLISTAVQDNSTIAEGQLDNCDGDANVDHLGLQVGTPQSLSDCSASAAGDPECSPVELPQLWNAGEAAQADAGEAAAECSCSFTIDNYIAAVYLDGVDVSSTVSGPLTSWSTLKQLTFPCSTTTVFAINGADAEHGCSTGDFAMQCSSTDVNSPWNGLTADGNWKAYGSSCSSSGCQHGIANPPAGWFLPSFDDSSWASATVGGGSHGSNRVGVPGVCTSGTGWLFRSPQLGGQCSCSFTIDNYIAGVYVDGLDVSSTVSGPLTSWSTLKQITFPCSTNTVFAINGADAEHGCSTGDFAMQCSSTDVNSPWNGLIADGTWKAYGSSCSSSGCQHGIADPPAGWFLPSFDDSSWASATVGGGSHGSNRLGVPGVCTDGTGWLFRSPSFR